MSVWRWFTPPPPNPPPNLVLMQQYRLVDHTMEISPYHPTHPTKQELIYLFF